MGVVCAFVFVLALLLRLFFVRDRLTGIQILTAGLLLAIGVPLLLPHMHERYFFLADALSIVWAAGNWRRFPVPAAVQVASFGGYHAYLTLQNAFPMAWGTWLLVAALGALVFSLERSLRQPTSPGAAELSEGEQ